MLVSVGGTDAKVLAMSAIALSLPLLTISLGGKGAKTLPLPPILPVTASGTVVGFSSSAMLLYCARCFFLKQDRQIICGDGRLY